MTLFALCLLELLLALSPEVFGEQRANEIFSTYDIKPGGIYVRERRARMRFMRPEFSTSNYWNGYRWNHATDARGFRNPPATGAEVLLVGDSLIYGHGVEEVETVGHVLRAEFGVEAYNMGRQGAALYDEYVFLRTFLPELQPKTVILFAFLNDFEDLEVYRTEDEISAVPEIEGIDYASIRQWAEALRHRLPSAPERWFWRRPSLRLLRSVAKELGGVALATPAWAAPPAPDPPFLAPLLDELRRGRLSLYYERILGDLANRCRARGIDLRLVYLPFGSDAKIYEMAQNSAVDLLRSAAGVSHIPVYDSRELFSGCEACFLASDGHFAAAGHKRLAEFLAGTVLSQGAVSVRPTDPSPRISPLRADPSGR